MTFGSILNQNTNGTMGVKESLFSTALIGLVFALFSAQPLMLLGVTGPMLIYEESLYNFLLDKNVNIVTARFWVACWAFMFSVLSSAFDASFLIRYVTRFADDILCTLISMIFFIETSGFLISVFHNHPVMSFDGYNRSALARNESYTVLRCCIPVTRALQTQPPQPNTALLTTVLVLGTFVIAFTLRRLREATYFGRKVRRWMAELALTIAIFVMILFDRFLIGDEFLSVKLDIRQDNQPLITLFAKFTQVKILKVEVWFLFYAIPAGLLLFLVLFVETEVCELMLSRKENCLKKGHGYHWDLVLCSMQLVLSASLGLPWLCADPVRSIAHLNSVMTYRLRAPGQPPVVDAVHEQRVTAIAINVAILLATVIGIKRSILASIPLAIMFGVFLYLGAMNLAGVGMLQRIILFFVPVKYHPTTVIYCRRVRTTRMHQFTIVQLICFACVAFVKWVPAIAIFYPVAIQGAVLVRHKLLPKIFTDDELIALDGEVEENEEGDDDGIAEVSKMR